MLERDALPGGLRPARLALLAIACLAASVAARDRPRPRGGPRRAEALRPARLLRAGARLRAPRDMDARRPSRYALPGAGGGLPPSERAVGESTPAGGHCAGPLPSVTVVVCV